MEVEKKSWKPKPDIMFRRVIENLMDGENVIIDGREFCISEEGQFCMIMTNLNTKEQNAYVLDFSFGAVYDLITNMTEEEYLDHSLNNAVMSENKRIKYSKNRRDQYE